jgi:hypothetical protein
MADADDEEPTGPDQRANPGWWAQQYDAVNTANLPTMAGAGPGYLAPNAFDAPPPYWRQAPPDMVPGAQPMPQFASGYGPQPAAQQPPAPTMLAPGEGNAAIIMPTFQAGAPNGAAGPQQAAAGANPRQQPAQQQGQQIGQPLGQQQQARMPGGFGRHHGGMGAGDGMPGPMMGGGIGYGNMPLGYGAGIHYGMQPMSGGGHRGYGHGYSGAGYNPAASTIIGNIHNLYGRTRDLLNSYSGQAARDINQQYNNVEAGQQQRLVQNGLWGSNVGWAPQYGAERERTAALDRLNDGLVQQRIGDDERGVSMMNNALGQYGSQLGRGGYGGPMVTRITQPRSSFGYGGWGQDLMDNAKSKTPIRPYGGFGQANMAQGY